MPCMWLYGQKWSYCVLALNIIDVTTDYLEMFVLNYLFHCITLFMQSSNYFVKLYYKFYCSCQKHSIWWNILFCNIFWTSSVNHTCTELLFLNINFIEINFPHWTNLKDRNWSCSRLLYILQWKQTQKNEISHNSNVERLHQSTTA